MRHILIVNCAHTCPAPLCRHQVKIDKYSFECRQNRDVGCAENVGSKTGIGAGWQNNLPCLIAEKREGSTLLPSRVSLGLTIRVGGPSGLVSSCTDEAGKDEKPNACDSALIAPTGKIRHMSEQKSVLQGKEPHSTPHTRSK